TPSLDTAHAALGARDGGPEGFGEHFHGRLLFSSEGIGRHRKCPQPTLLVSELLISSDARCSSGTMPISASVGKVTASGVGATARPSALRAEARRIRPAACAAAPSNEPRDAVSIPLFRPNRR